MAQLQADLKLRGCLEEDRVIRVEGPVTDAARSRQDRTICDEGNQPGLLQLLT